MYSFLCVFRSNYGYVFSRFDTIHERDSQPSSQTPHDIKSRTVQPH